MKNAIEKIVRNLKWNWMEWLCGSLITILVCLLLFGVIIPGLNNSSHRNDRKMLAVKAACENAYFQGQREALEGDVRIAKQGNEWIWTKCPWDGAKTQVLNTASEDLENVLNKIKNVERDDR